MIEQAYTADTFAFLSPLAIAQMIDLSAVRANSTDQNVREVIECAGKYQCFLVTILPSQTHRAKMFLQGSPAPKLGGNVGFPSGGQTTHIKVKETNELVKLGVDEVDMVIDIGALLSGRNEDVYGDIAAVVDAAEGRPVKVILECHYLNDDQIRMACDLAIRAGAAYVKTGTGWAPTGATLENVALIKKHVGETIKIKASGGIRSLDTLLAMYRLGASRFGISLVSAIGILEAVELRQNSLTPGQE